MMGDIINLRRARKRAVRAAKDETTGANRAKHGLSRTERDLGDAKRSLETRRLEAHRIALPGRETPEGA